ncbi:MAG TPA: glycosyl hydrolase family 17 protein [Anaerolineaceae bacterium]|jgi:exo-beta-1,3-glucanase (GH17 family)
MVHPRLTTLLVCLTLLAASGAAPAAAQGIPPTYLPLILNGEPAAQTLFYGLDFSPYMAGQSPNQGTKISEAQLRARMQIVAAHTGWVRSYGMDSGLELTGKVAHELGLKAALGAWLGRDLTANQAQIDSLIQAANAGEADQLIVGSETLYRGDLTEAQLVKYIQQVRKAAPAGIPIGVADVASEFQSHPAVTRAVDVVLANIYPYWNGSDVANAANDLTVAYQGVKTAAGTKPVLISETGWPTCGETRGLAVPSLQNAQTYQQTFLAWARANQVGYYYFEAFDEAWKAAPGSQVEACWGIWDQAGNAKPGLLP